MEDTGNEASFPQSGDEARAIQERVPPISDGPWRGVMTGVRAVLVLVLGVGLAGSETPLLRSAGELLMQPFSYLAN